MGCERVSGSCGRVNPLHSRIHYDGVRHSGGPRLSHLCLAYSWVPFWFTALVPVHFCLPRPAPRAPSSMSLWPLKVTTPAWPPPLAGCVGHLSPQAVSPVGVAACASCQLPQGCPRKSTGGTIEANHHQQQHTDGTLKTPQNRSRDS